MTMALFTLLIGSGGLAGIVGVFVTRKLGIRSSQNESTRDLNVTWDSIVENLQSQINTQTTVFTEQVKGLKGEIEGLKKRQGELEHTLNAKERLLLRAIAHMYKLETLIPSGLVPQRPEGLD